METHTSKTKHANNHMHRNVRTTFILSDLQRAPPKFCWKSKRLLKKNVCLSLVVFEVAQLVLEHENESAVHA